MLDHGTTSYADNNMQILRDASVLSNTLFHARPTINPAINHAAATATFIAHRLPPQLNRYPAHHNQGTNKYQYQDGQVRSYIRLSHQSYSIQAD